MTNIVSKYKTMTKEDKKEIAKKLLIGTSIGFLGFLIGKNMKRTYYDTEIRYLKEDLECMESDNIELGNIVDRCCITIKDKIDTINENEATIFELQRGVYERDLSIMELVDGNENRYRAIRSAVWDDESLLENANRLDKETLNAKSSYNAWNIAKDELEYI